MENTVATASRNLLKIKRRKASHYAYRGLQLVTRRSRDTTPSRILLYPAVESRETLGDLTNRLAWYLPEPTLRDDVELVVGTDLDFEVADLPVPECQAAYTGEHLPLRTVSPATLGSEAQEADALLTWDATSRTSLTAVRNIPKVELVDPTYFSGVESYTWGTFSSELRHDSVDDSAQQFRQLQERAASADRSYVFATGPSLSRAEEISFEDDALSVVCNSIVKDRELLEHIDPDVLVFADPVFHFSPNRYAATFRDDAAETLRTHDCLAVVPDRHRSLLVGHYPDLGVAGLESVDAPDPLFPTADDLRVMGTNNIMTWFMLPIASALTDEVNVIGADGREENSSYFWEHNEDAQYDDDLMAAAVDCHESFFRDRVYEDYYEQHCQTLAAFLEYGESRGITYNTLTESHVPCLSERTVPETKPMVT